MGNFVDHIKSCVPLPTRTIYRWISGFCLDCMENLRDRRRTGRPRPGTDQHVAWSRATVGDQNLAQYQCEFAWRTAPRVRQTLRAKFGSVLWRLPLPPPRSQRCATQSESAHGPRWENQEFPQLARRSQQLGILLACADESGRAAPSVFGRPGGSRGQTPRVGGQRALSPPPAGSQQPGGSARG